MLDFTDPKSIRIVKNYRTEIAAASSSILSTFVAFPLDFTKSRMQSYGTGLLPTVKDAYRAEGIRAFWRGVGPPLLSVTFVRTLSFSIYQRAKYAYDRSLTQMFGKSPLAHANAPGSYPSLLTIACFGPAGATSGFIVTFFSGPFELVKLNEQLAGKEARNFAMASNGATPPPPSQQLKTGAYITARRLVRDRGIFGLYAGLRLHLLRDTLGTGIYFITYESVKQMMANARGKSPTSPYAVLVAGGMCGIVSWAVVSRHEVVNNIALKANWKLRSTLSMSQRLCTRKLFSLQDLDTLNARKSSSSLISHTEVRRAFFTLEATAHISCRSRSLGDALLRDKCSLFQYVRDGQEAH